MLAVDIIQLEPLPTKHIYFCTPCTCVFDRFSVRSPRCKKTTDVHQTSPPCLASADHWCFGWTGIGEACPDVTSGLWLIAVTSLSLLLLWFWRRRLPEQVSPSQALGDRARSRAGSQSKQLCVPSCVLPLRPTTPLSLRRCLIRSERGLGQRKVPPVDFFFFFFFHPAWLDKKNSLNCFSYLQCKCSRLVLWQYCERVWDSAASLSVREVFFIAAHVSLRVLETLRHRSVSLIQIFSQRGRHFPRHRGENTSSIMQSSLYDLICCSWAH